MWNLIQLRILNQDRFRIVIRGRFWELIKQLYLQEHSMPSSYNL